MESEGYDALSAPEETAAAKERTAMTTFRSKATVRDQIQELKADLLRKLTEIENRLHAIERSL
jgi:hypothetical protein